MKQSKQGTQLPPGTNEVPISDAARVVLFQVMHTLRPRDNSELRGLGQVFREFNLEEIEAKFNTKAGVDLAKYGDTIRTIYVSEAGVIYLRCQFERLAETYPAGKLQDGFEVPAGLPVSAARKLAPLLDALEQAFPEPPPEATKPAP